MRLSRALIVFCFAMSSCIYSITTLDGDRLTLGSVQSRDYIEGVFRAQNETGSALAFAQEDASGDRYAELLGAEDALLAACLDLNVLATARRDEQRLTPREQARLAATAPLCESATADARRVLDGP